MREYLTGCCHNLGDALRDVRQIVFRRAVSPKIVRGLRTWWESEGAKNTPHALPSNLPSPMPAIGKIVGLLGEPYEA
jgi:hypothetical protein